MVMITLLYLQKIFSCLERRGGGGWGGMYMVLPQCCSQQEKIVDKTQIRQDRQDYLNSGHTLL